MTIEILKSKFFKFNRLYFNNELPPIKIRINRSKINFGQFVYDRSWDYLNGEFRLTPIRIDISMFYKRDDKSIDETLIHEMIHYYILYKEITDDKVHGKEFVRLMNHINSISGYNITITRSCFGLDIADAGKEYKFITFEYKNCMYWSRVSLNTTKKSLIKRFGTKVSDIRLYQTTDCIMGRYRNNIRGLSLLPMSMLTIKNYKELI